MEFERFELNEGDTGYPIQIADGYEKLPVIYGVGNREILQQPMLAIIGARRATPYGIDLAYQAGRLAAQAGITVVSGGAMGCDHAASRGALEAGGTSVIVSGIGADLIYPKSSEDIFSWVPRAGGAVIALEPWGQYVRRYAFPKRNRLIAALATSLLVTEAGKHSGTMTTADAAMRMGRNIYAYPGSVYSATSRGTNYLIANGAELILDAADLASRLSLDFGVHFNQNEVKLPRRGEILSALVANPYSARELASKITSTPLTIIDTLTMYEEEGYIVRMLDGRYTVTARGFHAIGTKE